MKTSEKAIIFLLAAPVILGLGCSRTPAIVETSSTASTTAQFIDLLSNKHATALRGIADSAPYIFFVADGEFIGAELIGIFDKKQNIFLTDDTIPAMLRFGDYSKAAISSDGMRFAFLVDQNSELYRIVDVQTLTTKDIPVDSGFTAYASSAGRKDSEGFPNIGKASWGDKNTFRFEEYVPGKIVEVVDSITQTNIYAKTIITDVATGETKQVWTYPWFNFDLPILPHVKYVLNGKGDGAHIVQSETGEAIGEIITAAQIPRVPLPPEKIEDVTIDGGIAAKIYHDRDAKTGTQEIDKLIFTGANGTYDIYIAVNKKFAAIADVHLFVNSLKWN